MDDAVQISADWCQDWMSGDQRIGLFRGRCRVQQGTQSYSADKMVIWTSASESKGEPVDRLTVYLEDRVESSSPTETISDSFRLVEIQTRQGVKLIARGHVPNEDGSSDAFFLRANERRTGGQRTRLQPTQYTIQRTVSPQQGTSAPRGPVIPGQPQVLQMSGRSQSSGDIMPLLPRSTVLTPRNQQRRVRISQRSSLPYQLQSFRNKDVVPAEQIVLLTGGITVLVDGVEGIGPIDLSADRVVIWTIAGENEEFSPETYLSRDTPYQVFLEGNIVIRQGTNVVKAERAFYDAREDRALIHDAELKADFPDIGGSVRVRAERLRQLARDSYHAQNAWITTSEFGKPGYRLQASDIFLEQRAASPTLFGRPKQYDPATGTPLKEEQPWITLLNSTAIIGETPIFYSPYASAPADVSQIPLEGLVYRQDSVFGSQVRTRWNAFQLLGVDRPAGTKWSFEADFLSKRGPLLGTDGNYRGEDDFGNLFAGNGIASYIYDTGTDNLGFDRRKLVPPDQNRGRFQWQHRHQLPENLVFDAEVGYVSDRNFLEQYYEREFDTKKDQETLGYLRQTFDTWGWSALVRPQINQFENNTQWLPKGDLYFLGEPLFDGLLSYSSHSTAGYAQLFQANPSNNPKDLYSPLPYFPDANGGVFSTRHELEAPFSLGPLQIAPYVLGEAAYWTDSMNSNPIDRYYLRAGLRGSLAFWKVFPEVRSEIFNLNGLAHKNVLSFDYSWSDVTRDLSEIPQWNEFDDNSQERFRQRLLFNTFGGVLPAQFDPRFYAIRQGAGASVTAPYHELVADQQALRLAWSQRLQTKVGPPDRLRVKDWMTLDLGVTYYPDSGRDNFGSEFGLFSGRYAWNVGDRTTFLASTLMDFFDGGQKLWSVGLISQRSVRGSVFLGYRQIQGGPIDSQIATASYSYVMSPKWITTMGTAYDVGEGQNRGQSLTLTRVGGDFLIHLGANIDTSKNNVGFGISVEPRFGAKNLTPTSTQLGPLLGTGF